MTKQDKLIEEQTKMAKWTKRLAIFTVILAISSIFSSGIALYMLAIQTPQPKLLIHILEDAGVLCSKNDTIAYGRLVKVANVGTRTAFDTKLVVSYNEEDSFHDAYFVEYSRMVNRTNPNIYEGWVYPREGAIIGYPYWVVEKTKTTIFLDEIEPGESIDLFVRFVGNCGSSKTITFEAKEEGYSISSGTKKSTIVWKEK